MNIQIVGHLAAEDLARLQLIQSRYEAVQLNPKVFSQDETRDVVLQYNKVVGELIQRYEIDEASPWQISRFTGAIIYGGIDEGY